MRSMATRSEKRRLDGEDKIERRGERDDEEDDFDDEDEDDLPAAKKVKQ